MVWCDQRAELQDDESQDKTSLDEAMKLSPEYNNTANLSREQRSTSNVVQLEGTLRRRCFTYDVCDMKSFTSAVTSTD